MTGKATETSAVLRNVAFLKDLDTEILDQIANRCEQAEIGRGETLITEGEAAETLYFVIRGRFVVLAGDVPIAIIRGGEPVGELGFFAGGPRTASVVAVRNSTVLKISKTAFEELGQRVPELTGAILESLAQRLAKATGANLELRPRPGRTVCVLPGGGEVIDPGFVAGLRAAFADDAGWQVAGSEDCPPEIRANKPELVAWLDALERKSQHLILVCEDPASDPLWFECVADICDTDYIVGQARTESDTSVALSDAEGKLFRDTLPGNLHLVLWRSQRATPIANSAAWLADRPVALHHHVALDSAEDFQRVARFVRGTAVGIVLCGGGAFGTAHLGALKALQEHGYTFDLIGGTSVGAALAAGMALDMPPDKIMGLCEDIFLKSKAMKKLAVPVHSVLDPSRLDAALQEHIGQVLIEDLPLNFFAVSTSLTTNDINVMRDGKLWQAVRASSALPGVFPPMVTDDGEVLIDGGLIDNVPINVARKLKPGPNLVFNLVAAREWRVDATYADLPGRLTTLARFVKKPGKSARRFPKMFSVLTRTMIVNSRRLLENTPMGEDILLQLPTLRRMGFLEWRKGRKLFQAAYDEMTRALENAGVPGAGASEAQRLDALRKAAEIVNALSERR